MEQDWVSKVNQWCQKSAIEHPEYSFDVNSSGDWTCHAMTHSLPVISETQATKKAAKHNCAKVIYDSYCKTAPIHITGVLTMCIIDGDQRADCWKWLASNDTVWDSREMTVKVYTGPTTPVVNCNSATKKIEHIQTRSAGRDAADIKILMDLGKFLATLEFQRYILVSSDHILVQVAQDIDNVQFAANLTQLKNILCE